MEMEIRVFANETLVYLGENEQDAMLRAIRFARQAISVEVCVTRWPAIAPKESWYTILSGRALDNAKAAATP